MCWRRLAIDKCRCTEYAHVVVSRPRAESEYGSTAGTRRDPGSGVYIFLFTSTRYLVSDYDYDYGYDYYIVRTRYQVCYFSRFFVCSFVIQTKKLKTPHSIIDLQLCSVSTMIPVCTQRCLNSIKAPRQGRARVPSARTSSMLLLYTTDTKGANDATFNIQHFDVLFPGTYYAGVPGGLVGYPRAY